MLTAMSDDGDGLALELTSLATLIRDLEQRLAQARSLRDERIRAATGDGGMSERAAASAAGVSPSYAHRAAKNGRFARTVRS